MDDITKRSSSINRAKSRGVVTPPRGAVSFYQNILFGFLIQCVQLVNVDQKHERNS